MGEEKFDTDLFADEIEKGPKIWHMAKERLWKKFFLFFATQVIR